MIFRDRCQLAPVLEVVKVTGRHRFTRFDLNRCNFIAIHEQTINLFAMIILPKIRQAIFDAMEVTLNKLIDDQILK
jgi:hypothetical protein